MSSSKKDRLSPNHRQRNAKLHDLKPGKANSGNKAKPSAGNGKKRAETRKPPSRDGSPKTDSHDSILEAPSRTPAQEAHYVAIVETETETETESPESKHNPVPILIAAPRKSLLFALIRDNETLRSNLEKRTAMLLDEKARNTALTNRIEHAPRDINFYKDNAPSRIFPIAVASALSFIAGCLTTAMAIAARQGPLQ